MKIEFLKKNVYDNVTANLKTTQMGVSVNNLKKIANYRQKLILNFDHQL